MRNDDFKVGTGKLKWGQTDIEVVNPISSSDLTELVKMINSKEIRQLASLGSGGFGEVWEYKDYAIKYLYDLNREDYSNWIVDEENFEATDTKVLKRLQGYDFVPKFYSVIDKRYLIIEKIEGETVDDYTYVPRNESNNYINPEFIEKYKESLRTILKIGYMPNDLHKGNVMIRKDSGLPVIVDVGLFYKNEIKDELLQYVEDYDLFTYNLVEFVKESNTYDKEIA